MAFTQKPTQWRHYSATFVILDHYREPGLPIRGGVCIKYKFKSLITFKPTASFDFFFRTKRLDFLDK